MFHYKKGTAYNTSADSVVLYQDVASNTLLNDVFCYFVHNLPKFQNMHPYRITPGTDIAGGGVIQDMYCVYFLLA